MRRAKPENMVQAHIYALHLVGDDPLDEEVRRYVGHCTRPDSLHERLREHLGHARRGGHGRTYAWIREVGEDRVAISWLETCSWEDKKAREIAWWERSPNACNGRPR